jgi:hypothetical protein
MTIDNATKIELLKIAAQLTVANLSEKTADRFEVHRKFEHFSYYLFENFEQLGLTERIN